ncbi:hypothetical protein SAMN05661086_03488 [Anaeromicropila populeti]|uniref:RNA polymerase subunit sigma-70 n=2 Tax=Anaeromicropila populeti TaxID=37658 RepID=A0A1I6LQY8_9FIRM|nr:hypothetical protein SAMN05661086_03488 [Anaeromicropila populeti]
MTASQEKQIRELRMRGIGYRAIGSVVGVSRDIVRNFCKARGLEGYAKALTKNVMEQMQSGEACFYCGKRMEQPYTGRPRKFCSNQCRRDWWKAHPEAVEKRKTAVYQQTCACCGITFEAYGNRNRKYCSHNCYIKDRFWREENGI